VTAMRAVNAVMAAAFLLSVAVQVNDPDPLRWMAIYGSAAALCIAWERRWGSRWLPAALAAVAAAWAAWIAAHTVLAVPLSTALADWGMHAGGSEQAREVGGLLLVVAWMGGLTARPRS